MKNLTVKELIEQLKKFDENNVVLDAVIKCEHPEENQVWILDWLQCEKCKEILV